MRSSMISHSAQTLMGRIQSQKNLTWHEIMGSNILIDYGLKFDLNFDDFLWRCFKGVEVFELLKFSLPEHLRLISIRKEKCSKNVNAVIKMLRNYNSIMDRLTDPQVSQCFSYKQIGIRCFGSEGDSLEGKIARCGVVHSTRII